MLYEIHTKIQHRRFICLLMYENRTYQVQHTKSILHTLSNLLYIIHAISSVPISGFNYLLHSVGSTTSFTLSFFSITMTSNFNHYLTLTSKRNHYLSATETTSSSNLNYFKGISILLNQVLYYMIYNNNSYYPSSGRSFVIVRQVSPPPSSGCSLSIVRQVSLSRSVPGVSCFCQSHTHTWMTLTLTLPETLPGWTWVRVSSLVSIGPAVWPAIRNIDTYRQTNKQT